MPRFVILLHETPVGYSRPTHFDLMLECGHVLKTWAFEMLPVLGEATVAERLPDHRPVYLDYEGTVGNDRGSVTRVAAGDFEMLEDSESRTIVRLAGDVKGTLTLEYEDDHRCRAVLSADD